MQSYQSQRYGALMTPPIHPDRTPNSKEEERQRSIEQCVETMPQQDQDFMYEQRKNHLHQERVLSSFLKIIRKYDFLPKQRLLEAFQAAVKHIYTLQEQALKEEKRAAKELQKWKEIEEETQKLKEAEE